MHIAEHVLRHGTEITWRTSYLPTDRTSLRTWHHWLLALTDTKWANTARVSTILIVWLLMHLLLLGLGSADLIMVVQLLLVLLRLGLCSSGWAGTIAATYLLLLSMLLRYVLLLQLNLMLMLLLQVLLMLRNLLLSRGFFHSGCIDIESIMHTSRPMLKQKNENCSLTLMTSLKLVCLNRHHAKNISMCTYMLRCWNS